MGISYSTTIVVVTFLPVLLWLGPLRLRKREVRVRTPFPPGPKGLPLIKNLFDMPVDNEIKAFTEWGNKYGPISHAEVFGEHIIILNSYDAVYDLLEKRSLVYSGRRKSRMMNEFMGWGYLTVFLQYGERLQAHRSLMHKYLQPSVAKGYEDQETKVALRLLGNLLKTPEHFFRHMRSAAVGSVLLITYGHEPKAEDDFFVTIGEEGMKWLGRATTPGAYWVDFLPWLRYIPDGFPGTGWKIDGKIAHDISTKMLYEPFRLAKEQIAKGSNPPCILNEMLDDTGATGEKTTHFGVDEKLIAETVSTIYAGGADTAVSNLHSAILAIVLNNNILKKAQEEIDVVIGNDRLPTLGDRPSLPYIEGIVKEALRWNPALPLGVPHRSDQEDVYNDYRIPAKSLVIANLWTILHDPEIYPDPTVFRPERWLDSEGKLLDDASAPMHPNKVAFGFGRRICPGRHVAEDILFTILSNVLAVFNIEKATDDSGRPITPTATYSSKFISHPDRFECSIRPRSRASEMLITEASVTIT